MTSPAAFAATAALLAEPPRAAMLQALLSGEALTAGELARVAGIGAPAASAHLARLVEGGLVAVHPQGRHRYHRLASEEVAAAIETLGGLAAAVAPPTRRWPHGEAFRRARLCYNHLAGRLGVAIHAGLTGRGWITPAPGGWTATAAGETELAGLGVDLPAARQARRFACDCMDWSERRAHLAGGLGREIAACCLRRHWLSRLPGESEGDPLARRRLALTPEGARRLGEALGVARLMSGDATIARPAAGLAPATRLLIALALMTGASQFHRAALGVVGPELAAALEAGPGLLGAANGAFFLALLLLQVPVGLALDRIGPRRTVAWLAAPAALGALGQALAPDAAWFLAARFLLGLGCAASFMASVVLCARWHAGPGLTTALARVFALSQGGILLAGAPFAAAAEGIGWRGAYAISGVLTLGLAVLWWGWVRDDPPDRPPPARPAETLAGALRGQLTVWRTPGLLPVLAMHLVGYAAMATVIAVWAGPYLSEVHGLAPGPRGTVLFAMGLALVAGLLGVGPLERRLNTRKWLVAGMASGAVLTLVALAAWPQPPLPAAIGLLVGLCLFSAYPVVVVAHGRSLFADHQVGRGATTVNLAQTLGSAALPAMTGWAVAFAPQGEAWPIAFGTLAVALALGLAGYLTGRDAPPKPG